MLRSAELRYLCHLYPSSLLFASFFVYGIWMLLILILFVICWFSPIFVYGMFVLIKQSVFGFTTHFHILPKHKSQTSHWLLYILENIPQSGLLIVTQLMFILIGAYPINIELASPHVLLLRWWHWLDTTDCFRTLSIYRMTKWQYD